MKRLGLLISIFSVSLYFSGMPGFAQMGQGGGAGHSGGGASGGRGPMTMPGSQGPSQGHGMLGMEQGGKAGMEHGRNTDTERMGSHTGMAGQRTAAEHLQANQMLSTKVTQLFPAGTNVADMAAGFKNLGDFVAAAHVSHNLGIPFGELKAKMTTGKNLGEAIHELRPDVNHKAEAKKAKNQAKNTLKGSTS
ncbi:MAG: hypothetical protein HY651_13315 [Acidobacteria bacterium]|nr:hypothetical protein [Acidobacteriota bacterium]